MINGIAWISIHPNNISNRFIIGFLYEFTLTQDYGDFFLLYGNKSFDHSRIGFEFGDNSA